jgi:hypothetical protein
MRDAINVKGRRSVVAPEKWAEVRVKFEHGVPVKELAALVGMKPASITSFARRHGWASHGSSRDAAIEIARRDAETEMSEAYTTIVRQVNDRHLENFRFAASVANDLLGDIHNRIAWAREETVRQEKQAREDNLPVPAPVSTANDAAVLVRVLHAMKIALIEGERFILGITDGSLRKEEDDGADQIVAILQLARAEYGLSHMEED